MVQISVLALAVVMVVFATPLFLNLALCIVGNLRRPSRLVGALRKSIHLALVVPAHDEELMIARTLASVREADKSIPIFVLAHNCSDSTASVVEATRAHVVVLDNPKRPARELRCAKDSWQQWRRALMRCWSSMRIQW